MFEAQSITAEHKDLIHDVAYDYYGQRMATCSSDQFVKVWDQDEQDGWLMTASWKAHSGSVWKVTWAHPEFGQVLATCSFDRTAAVWEEIVGEGSAPGDRGTRHWVRRTNLVDSRTSVTDVSFAPKALGLLLAACSADGVVRIYEAPDVMNLSQWTLQHEISCKLPCSCLSWNPSFNRNHPPMLAVGSDDPNASSGSKVFIYEYSENMRRWNKTESLSTVTDPVHDIAFAPNLGRSFHLLAIAAKDIRIVTLRPQQDSTEAQSGLPKLDVEVAAHFDDHYNTVWRVCWNITGTILASSGDDGCVRLWKANYQKAWKCVSVLKGDGTQAQSDPATPAVPLPASVATGASQGSGTRPVEETPAAASKWQAPVIKGRFQKMTWLGADPPPPVLPPSHRGRGLKK
ncbi:nucleoporin SEH1 isoform X2 [Bacillus rossius redtenbacheri]|uniref:nucleoporin SEH1 isoform X2 n=1 Tax=Bacillus rossius redtenbacheri TaxID=93214 RepID=UPI002FDCD116